MQQKILAPTTTTKKSNSKARHATPVHVHLASVQTGSIIERATATANNSIN
jgi:hypothetical protein